MHKNILTQEQIELLPFVKKFSKQYFLVGGTAIALQIGHRRSIDFDLFTKTSINKSIIKRQTKNYHLQLFTRYESKDQLTGTINKVQFTWIEYPHDIPVSKQFDKIIKMPDLLTLAAMKAHALGQWAKWKDYVDMYFITNKYYSLKDISQQAENLFGTLFNAKLFLQQLCYFQDIDYTETVEYVTNPVKDETIKKSLIKIATEKL
jgi:hypothetical protein